jgi:tetratricopeptide (TPR) repeat protein
MKQSILVIGFISIINFSYGQTFIGKMQNKICECITVSVDYKTGMNDQKFTDCWIGDSLFIKEMSDSLSNIDSLNSYDDGYKWGMQYFENNQLKFILECDAWYRFIDSARYSFLGEMDSATQIKKIDTITQFLNKHGDQSDYYRQRGMAYFSLSKYDQAKKDFDKALNLPDANPQNLYFRGWIAELKGNYDEALTDYKLAREITGVIYIDNLIGIAERKKKEAANSH